MHCLVVGLVIGASLVGVPSVQPLDFKALQSARLQANSAMLLGASATMGSSFFEEVESLCFRNLGPAAALRRERVKFMAAVKAFNMSASYATSFGSGARELVQNWWDECRVADRRPAIQQVDSAILAEIAGRHQLRPDAKAYLACDNRTVLGALLACTDQTGKQLLLLKNYGAQMTLDDLILGESTKRQDMALAGVACCLLSLSTMQ